VARRRDEVNPRARSTTGAAFPLGVNYVGFYDEVSLFSRALTDEEVRSLHTLEEGVTELHP
jgi:hypothetical protein